MPSTAEVIIGGPSSSGPAIPPCAYARVANMPIQRSATTTARKRRKTVRIALLASASDGLDISADRPPGEVAPDELADPIADHRHRAAKQQRHVLGLAEKAAQRAAFDVPHVFGRLGADINDTLYVGDCEDVMHELHGLEERGERYVIEGPHHHGPYPSAEERSEREAFRPHQQPVENYGRRNRRYRPYEIQRIAFGHVPLEVTPDPRGH